MRTLILTCLLLTAGCGNHQLALDMANGFAQGMRETPSVQYQPAPPQRLQPYATPVTCTPTRFGGTMCY